MKGAAWAVVVMLAIMLAISVLDRFEVAATAVAECDNALAVCLQECAPEAQAQSAASEAESCRLWESTARMLLPLARQRREALSECRGSLGTEL